MNFIITDFVQALNTSHSSSFNVFTTEDLDWSFWHIIQIIILSYLKFLTVYVSICPSNHLNNICISTIFKCMLLPFPDICSPNFVPILHGKLQNRLQTKIRWLFFFPFCRINLLFPLFWAKWPFMFWWEHKGNPVGTFIIIYSHCKEKYH